MNVYDLLYNFKCLVIFVAFDFFYWLWFNWDRKFKKKVMQQKIEKWIEKRLKYLFAKCNITSLYERVTCAISIGWCIFVKCKIGGFWSWTSYTLTGCSSVPKENTKNGDQKNPFVCYLWFGDDSDDRRRRRHRQESWWWWFFF